MGRSLTALLLSASLLGVPAQAVAGSLVPRPVYCATPTRKDFSHALRSAVGLAKAGTPRDLPADANRYRYVVVPGLLGKHFPGYMDANVAALRGRGLDVHVAGIDTDGPVAKNARTLEALVRGSDKPVVFVAHSKGVVEATAAVGRLMRSEPALVRAKVRGLVSMEGAYGGSPVADLVSSTRAGRFALRLAAKALGGHAEAVLDLRTATRHAATAAEPMPTDVVPTVSLVGYKTTWKPYRAPGLALMKRVFGLTSDGLVAHRDAVIPGSDVARVPIDHTQATSGPFSGELTIALVDHLLRMPYVDPTK